MQNLTVALTPSVKKLPQNSKNNLLPLELEPVRQPRKPLDRPLKRDPAPPRTVPMILMTRTITGQRKGPEDRNQAHQSPLQVGHSRR